MARTLTITRTSFISGALVKFSVQINGRTVAKLGNGETVSLQISEDSSTLTILPTPPLKAITETIPSGQDDLQAEVSLRPGLILNYLHFEFLSGDPADRKKKGFFDSLKDSYQEKKAADEAERNFVRNHKGTEAICAYMKMLFDKGNTGYNWLKANRTFPLYPKVENNQVLLCYSYTQKDPQSFSEMKPKDEEVARYSFQQMYSWYGLSDGEGYSRLDTKLKVKELELQISYAVQELPHIRYNGGFVVKLFQ